MNIFTRHAKSTQPFNRSQEENRQCEVDPEVPERLGRNGGLSEGEESPDTSGKLWRRFGGDEGIAEKTSECRERFGCH